MKKKVNGKKVRLTKQEKRTVLFERKYEHQNERIAKYSSDSVGAVAKTVNRRVIAAFLAFVFALSCLVVGVNFATKAEEVDGFNMFESDDESGFVTRKGLKDNGDGTYDIRMEAYATKEIATKTLDSKTPLDVVMVMDQSGSMTTADVYNKISKVDSNKTSYTISDIQDRSQGQYYYHDEADDKDYPIQVDTTSNNAYAEVTMPTGGWTAQNAHDWVASNQYLYYKNGNSYDVVYASSGNTKYKSQSSNVINVTSLKREWFTSNIQTTDYYIFVENENGNSCWHRIYYCEDGYLGEAYYYTFYYYTNSIAGSSLTNTSTLEGKQAGQTAGDVTLLTNYHSHKCYSWGGTGGLSESQYKFTYTGGDAKLYKTNGTSSNYNILYTDSYILACQEPDSYYSHSYNGVLYAKGYRLYYEKDDGTIVPIGNAVLKTSDTAYTVSDADTCPQLYEDTYITRLQAMQESASEFTEKLGAAVSASGVDTRIAVVGFTDTASILAGTNTAATALVDLTSNDEDSNKVNDAIDTAIRGLTATSSNGSSLSAGLAKASDIFSADEDNDGSRKRVVIVLTDAQPAEEDANARVAAKEQGAILKDTYNASIYTVGICITDSDAADFSEKLSSNYFTSKSDGTETKSDDGIQYYYNKADRTELKETADTIAGSINTTITTSVVLDGENSILKDIISSNFVVPNSPTVTVQTATGTYTNGELSFGSATTYTDCTATWDDQTLTIKGFDFNGNYISESQSGKKLIVTISGLTRNEKVKTDSDKRIYSNDAASGIYKSGNEELLIATFPRPYLDNITNMAPAGGTGVMSGDGIVVNKYIAPNANGMYDLTLEAYTTQTSEDKVEKVPTDFVVVVAQSGSMSTKDMPTGYQAVSGGKTIEEVAEGNYYIKASDGNYYRVYGTKDYLYRYYNANYWYVGSLIDRFGTDLGWFMGNTDATTTFQNQMYFREVVDGTTYYQPITMTVQGKIGTYYIKFHYNSKKTNSTVYFNRDDTTYSSNGNSPWYRNFVTGNTMKSGAGWWAADAAVQAVYTDDTAYTFSEVLGANTGMYINYPMYDRKVGYTKLCYRDMNGVEHTLSASNGQSTWEFCNDSSQALTAAGSSTRPSYTGLYEPSGYMSRLEALKDALTQFAKAVANETDDVTAAENKAVDNKIAIVGFSSPTYSTYNNTELLTGENLTISNKNGVRIDNATDADYKTALVSASNGTAGTVNSKITDAIDALSASGGTQPEDGLNMAYQILSKRSVTTYKPQFNANTYDRNQIVIFFTDGQPGDFSYSNQYAEANDVVEAALPIKTTQGATLFSIGVFGESDGNPLTYPADHATKEDANWKYADGWVETHKSGTSSYYSLNRYWLAGRDGYTTSANDTIYDYMSVVSSNYPNAAKYIAPSWISGTYSGTYTEATDGVRSKSTATASNDHYRMASNQDTLVAAFSQAITMTNQTISSSVRLDASAILRDVLKNDATGKDVFVPSSNSAVNTATVVGIMDKNGVVNFKESTKTPVSLVTSLTTDSNGTSTVNVRGFDYLANYIAYGKAASGDLEANQGKKLVVTITDVCPTFDTIGDTVYSNDSASAMYVSNNAVATFPQPYITRHGYTLNVGDINTNATFDVTATIVNGSGNAVDKTNDDVEDVIIVYPNGDRALYSSVGAQTFSNMANGESFYFENVPSGYQIQTSVTTTDDSYVYSVQFDGETPATMEAGTPKTHNYAYADNTINITSARGNKDVTIWEQTIGSYANVSQDFDEAITMTIPVTDTTKTTYEFPCVYKGTSGTATFKADGEVKDGFATVKLTSVGVDGATVNDGKLNMLHGDSITITVPTETTVKVKEDAAHEHSVFYYTSQDDVDPSTIKLQGEEVTTGEYEMTFVKVDGVEADDQTITFENGVVTKVNNKEVASVTSVDLAPYQGLAFKSDADIGYPVLNINGKTYTFEPEETEDGKYVYIATFNRAGNDSGISATVEKDNVDILIVNERGDITIEGIDFGDNHNWVIYILAGMAGLAVAGFGVYLWKKKDQFVED